MANPTLYLFIRNDIYSMNAGKAVAQGSHATNDFEIKVRMAADQSVEWHKTLNTWRNGECAGRALVFGATGAQFENLKILCEIYESNSSNQKNILWGSYTDPTYPLRDGQLTHTIPFNSAMWIFTADGMPSLKENPPMWEAGCALNNIVKSVNDLKLY